MGADREESLHLGLYASFQVREGRPDYIWEAEGRPSGVSSLSAQGEPTLNMYRWAEDSSRGSRGASGDKHTARGCREPLSATFFLPQSGPEPEGGSKLWKATQ